MKLKLYVLCLLYRFLPGTSNSLTFKKERVGPIYIEVSSCSYRFSGTSRQTCDKSFTLCERGLCLLLQEIDQLRTF